MKDSHLKVHLANIKLLEDADQQVKEAIERRNGLRIMVDDYVKENKVYVLNKCCDTIPDIIDGNMIFPYIRCPKCGERTNHCGYIITAIKSWNLGERQK